MGSPGRMGNASCVQMLNRVVTGSMRTPGQVSGALATVALTPLLRRGAPGRLLPGGAHTPLRVGQRGVRQVQVGPHLLVAEPLLAFRQLARLARHLVQIT